MQTEPPGSGNEGASDASRPSEPVDDRPAKPISQLVLEPEFPKSALGELVDIGGYTGVVVELVHQSLKVRAAEGTTKSFNVAGLRKIYGPRVVPEPFPPAESSPAPGSATRPVAPLPEREVAIAPDFTKPLKSIRDYVIRENYPKCVLGEHVEIGGYAGVVVEIVNRSLKVRSQAETTRSYNADALRKLYSS